ncbi:MAG: hypothetical protein QM759_03945 [Terricaulis sp.]
MRAIIIAAVLSALGLSASAGTANPLAPLEFFKGCWHGVFAGSATVTDERCLAPMLGGAYIRDTHVVHGGPLPYAGEAIYRYDPQPHRIAVTYYAQDGVERGFADAAEHGLSFPQADFIGDDGNVTTLRATWTPDGPDRFVAVAEFLENGRWVEHLHITYTRAPNVSPPAQ